MSPRCPTDTFLVAVLLQFSEKNGLTFYVNHLLCKKINMKCEVLFLQFNFSFQRKCGLMFHVNHLLSKQLI